MQVKTLENENLKAVFLDYGAVLHQLWVKDKNDIPINIVMGLETPEDYHHDNWSRGAVIGRFAGRLENPIQIGSKQISIEHSEGVLLHSGSSGWGKKTWDIVTQKLNQVSFRYICREGASGFPGQVVAHIHYRLEEDSLSLEYHAQTNIDTHINLTNHAYFNLNPEGKINRQYLRIHADEVLELKPSLVPTGLKKAVNQTSFDFRKQKQIGENRMDDYFVLNNKSNEAAVLFSSETGIEMSTHTDQPGIVVFTPPHFDAICFETQKFSNTPNIKNFPTTLVKKEEAYRHKTLFKFRLRT